MNERDYIKDTSRGRTCFTCRYAYEVQDGAGLTIVECRRRPPQGRPVEGMFVGSWPAIPALDAGEPWCGEWREKERTGWPWA